MKRDGRVISKTELTQTEEFYTSSIFNYRVFVYNFSLNSKYLLLFLLVSLPVMSVTKYVHFTLLGVGVTREHTYIQICTFGGLCLSLLTEL